MTLACIGSFAGSSACDFADVEEPDTEYVGEEDEGLLEREMADEPGAWASQDPDADAVAAEQVASVEAALCHHLGTWTINSSCTYYGNLVLEAQRRCRARGGALKSHRFELTCAPHAYRRIVYSCCAS